MTLTGRNWSTWVCAIDIPHARVTLTTSQVQSISKKYKKAISAREESHNVLNELDACVDKVKRKSWKLQEQDAMSSRGDHLKIYDVVLDKGERDGFTFIGVIDDLGLLYQLLQWLKLLHNSRR